MHKCAMEPPTNYVPSSSCEKAKKKSCQNAQTFLAMGCNEMWSINTSHRALHFSKPYFKVGDGGASAAGRDGSARGGGVASEASGKGGERSVGKGGERCGKGGRRAGRAREASGEKTLFSNLKFQTERVWYETK